MTADEIMRMADQAARRYAAECEACRVGWLCVVHAATVDGIEAVAEETRRRERIIHYGRL